MLYVIYSTITLGMFVAFVVISVVWVQCRGLNPAFHLACGVGLPKDLDLKKTETLGLRLVNTLIDQLEARIEIKREHGTEFRISL